MTDHAVYPRWRGEHIPFRTLTTSERGLSPLARGTLAPEPRQTSVPRFIPAGAGNTLAGHLISVAIPVYPRWRGEHRVNTAASSSYDGLSPLARGTLNKSGIILARIRFIPAGAGNTPRPARRHQPAPVYPRWRGEHTESPDLGLLESGLSPLARGTRRPFLFLVLLFRFIPAGAGNTGRLPIRFFHQPVYPRWRGEHYQIANIAAQVCGLSPLARGTRNVQIVFELRLRFIPAGAGNTLQRISTTRYRAVYPRWRGEHPPTGAHLPLFRGLSPLARGTL
ncbi:Domain of uncharacterised function (DUF2825) [Salmonella enterica subsp. salamae]|nr:Domain of uncharacterised function (DUF2825) [Salmonella enterica subsp. salamae]